VPDADLGAHQADHEPGEVEDAPLVGAADVHRAGVVREQQPQQAVDLVLDVDHRSRLQPVAGNRQVVTAQGLADEGRDGAPVVGAHPRPVGVEDAGDGGVDAVRRPVGDGQGLGEPLGLVVDAAGTDRVHVAPVRLGLRVHLGVAVHLGRRGQQEPRVLGPGQAEGVQRADGTDLERLERHPQVVDG
jgi:hypothetical protein